MPVEITREENSYLMVNKSAFSTRFKSGANKLFVPGRMPVVACQGPFTHGKAK